LAKNVRAFCVRLQEINGLGPIGAQHIQARFFFATRISPNKLIIQRFLPFSADEKITGLQDHTTSPSATTTLVSRGFRVHRIPPRVRDVRTPLLSGETGELVALICPTG
jgi:hypothetical protein